MEWSSWFRRSLSKTSKETNSNEPSKTHQEKQQDFLGVTQELIEHVKSFTLETFINFPHPEIVVEDEDRGGGSYGEASTATTTPGNVKKDLSEWQERHAVLVLSKVKELTQLRFKLCPRHLKEHEFWRVYFSLVKSYVAEYELQAIRLAKLESMATENERALDGSTIEVEMAETKTTASLTPPTP